MKTNKTKYIIYARKATGGEDKQVMSIEQQLFELRELAEKEGPSIVADIIE